MSEHNISGWKVGSAGIEAKQENIDSETRRFLGDLGINNISHQQTILRKEMLTEYDIIISMAKNHQEYLKSEYGVETYLFNELAIGQNESIADISEEVEDYKTNRPAVIREIDSTIKTISDRIPSLYENISKL